jgi:urea transport system permease protein
VGFYRFFDLSLDGLSLASIYFLAAIGLAITFGVMGVINMAHGEFIMIGAYTGYVVQTLVPNETASHRHRHPAGLRRHLHGGRGDGTAGDPLALSPAAGNAAGDFRHLHRAATDRAAGLRRADAAPDAARLAGGVVALNDVVSISSIRIAIFILAAIFFVVLWLILNRTRLGLEVRAVTQNPAWPRRWGSIPTGSTC